MSSSNGIKSWHFLILSVLDRSVNWWGIHRKLKYFVLGLSRKRFEIDVCDTLSISASEYAT
jgi:hypothetical protein